MDHRFAVYAGVIVTEPHGIRKCNDLSSREDGVREPVRNQYFASSAFKILSLPVDPSHCKTYASVEKTTRKFHHGGVDGHERRHFSNAGYDG